MCVCVSVCVCVCVCFPDLGISIHVMVSYLRETKYNTPQMFSVHAVWDLRLSYLQTCRTRRPSRTLDRALRTSDQGLMTIDRWLGGCMGYFIAFFMFLGIQISLRTSLRFLAGDSGAFEAFGRRRGQVNRTNDKLWCTFVVVYTVVLYLERGHGQVE